MSGFLINYKKLPLGKMEYCTIGVFLNHIYQL